MVAGLLVGIWVARYLGPEQFGVLSYVSAFVGLFVPLEKLGFDGIISRNIAKNVSGVDILLSTASLFKLLGSVVIVVVAPGYMYFFKEESVYFYLALLYSFIFVFQSFEVLEFYYRAKVKAKYISIANGISMLVSAALKVVFILSGLSLVYFAVANLLEAFVAAVLLIIFFRREDVRLSLQKASLDKGFELLKESWPLILSGFFALVLLNIDQVMIEEILGSYEVGQYSAAARISSAWYFIPLTLGWSIQTAVVNAKKKGEKLYYERLQMLFTLMALMAYALIIPIAIFSSEIIHLLYGEAYALAGEVLAVHILASLFVFVGLIRGLWVTNESYFKFELLANLGAGIINIMLNLLWLLPYGINGAAWATLVSYAVTYVFSGVLFRPARKIVVMQLKSMMLIDVWNQMKKLKQG